MAFASNSAGFGSGFGRSQRVIQVKPFRFSHVSYEGNSDIKISFVPGGFTYHLHEIILKNRCPGLLSIDQNVLESFNFSEQASAALITFIYQDRLLDLEFIDLIDFHTLTTLLVMVDLSDHVLSKILASCADQTASMISSAFCKLMEYPKFNSNLFDRLYSYISKKPTEYASTMELIAAGPESFVRLAILRMFSANIPINKTATSEPNPFGKLYHVVETLFKIPSPYQEADFTIACENQKFSCHKLLLVLRWPYFAKAMKFDSMEAQNNILNLPTPTFSPTTTEVFIKYLYTNECANLSASTALEILKHAELFEIVTSSRIPITSMEELIERSKSIVFAKLEIETCVTYLKDALEFGNAEDIKKARSFVAQVLRSGRLASIQAQMKSLSAEEVFTLVTWEASST